MISAPTVYQKDAGMMEYWNTGIMVPFEIPNIPSFQVPKKVTVYKFFRHDNSWPSEKSFLDKSDW